jgi:monomeric sarcosine oxidase
VTQRFDVIVVGAGAIGTSTARWLAARGRNTLLLERFEIGHARGSSGGPTRVFRLTYDHPDYVRMARLALEEWRALEDEAGEPLMITTAGLDVGRAGRSSAEALEAAGETFEYLAVDAVTERWPALRLDPEAEVFVQENGGVCMAERTVLAQTKLAVDHGATVLENTHVLGVVANGDGAEVRTEADTYDAGAVVVTAGPWARDLLLGAGIDVPLQPSLEQVTYFALEDPSPLPTVIDWDVTPPRTPYTVPDPTRPGHFKVALHMSGPPVDAEARSFEPDRDRERRVIEYAAGRFAPHAPDGGTETCLYTNTPDEHFVFDRVGPIVVGSPCSGHGFKFAPLSGLILADLAMGRKPPAPIDRFAVSRFA